MQHIKLYVSKENVLSETEQTTAYTAAKMESEDPTATTDRLAVTDFDHTQLSRFWDECCTEVSGIFRRLAEREHMMASGYEVTLLLPDTFPADMTNAMNRELFSFFVHGMAARWYALARHDAAADSLAASAAALERLLLITNTRRRPKRQ